MIFRFLPRLGGSIPSLATFFLLEDGQLSVRMSPTNTKVRLVLDFGRESGTPWRGQMTNHRFAGKLQAGGLCERSTPGALSL